MSAILQKKANFLYPGTKYGGQNPLTIHEIYAALISVLIKEGVFILWRKSAFLL